MSGTSIEWTEKTWNPPHNGLTTLRVRSKGGNMAEWPEDLRVREMPVVRS